MDDCLLMRDNAVVKKESNEKKTHNIVFFSLQMGSCGITGGLGLML